MGCDSVKGPFLSGLRDIVYVFQETRTSVHHSPAVSHRHIDIRKNVPYTFSDLSFFRVLIVMIEYIASKGHSLMSMMRLASVNACCSFHHVYHVYRAASCLF